MKNITYTNTNNIKVNERQSLFECVTDKSLIFNQKIKKEDIEEFLGDSFVLLETNNFATWNIRNKKKLDSLRYNKIEMFKDNLNTSLTIDGNVFSTIRDDIVKYQEALDISMYLNEDVCTINSLNGAIDINTVDMPEIINLLFVKAKENYWLKDDYIKLVETKVTEFDIIHC